MITKNKTHSSAQIENNPIGVFDSGVGGLSVLRELQALLPNENFVFLADQKYVPYGEKSKAELVKIVYRVADYFVKNHNIKMLVVACNTSTCMTIADLRAKYKFPIVGTVPAVKVAAEKTKSKTIGIISTPSTSKSETLKKLIKDNCRGIRVVNIPCKGLADEVEQGELNSKEIHSLLAKYLKEIRDSKADELVLGCTHYVFLQKAIAGLVGHNIALVDGNQAIARHTQSLLHNHMIENDQKKGKTVYFTTGDSAIFAKVASILLKKKIKASSLAF